MLLRASACPPRRHALLAAAFFVALAEEGATIVILLTITKWKLCYYRQVDVDWFTFRDLMTYGI